MTAGQLQSGLTLVMTPTTTSSPFPAKVFLKTKREKERGEES
jgi:hypothetical protein